MILPLILLQLVSSEFYLCDEEGHACKKGTTCCVSTDTPEAKYSCCPFADAVCCGDSGGHCCPSGYPVCDIENKRCMDHLGNSMSSLSYDPNQNQGLEWISGFLLGVSLEFGVEEFFDCFYKAFLSLFNLYESIRYIQGEETIDTLIIVDSFGKFLQYATQGSVVCRASYLEGYSRIETLVQEFSEIPALISLVEYNILQKGNYIAREFNYGRNSYGFESGKHFGKAIALIFKQK